MIDDDEGALRERAREVLQAGTLPNRRPDRMWGGPGTGTRCAICLSPVTRDELEFEIEFARNGGNGDNSPSSNFHVHTRCFAAWELERHNLQPASEARP